MKKLFTLFLLVGSLFAQAQTANSIANGNWTNPLTWSCTCVPMPGNTINISHDVILNTDFAIPSGSITITATGSLDDNGLGYDIWVNGGTLNVQGDLSLQDLWTQSGTFTVSGNVSAAAILNQINLTNNGNFHDIDSMVNTATLINNGDFLNIDSITNTGTFTNNGNLLFNQVTNTGTFTNNGDFTFTDITNLGTLTNNDTITAQNSVWNPGKMTLNPNSFFLVTNDILNYNFLTNDKAVITNNGRMVVLDSWYNYDTIRGTTGSFVVQDTSANWGQMLGSFDFCDLTPPASQGSIVDYNIGGTISPNITWCMNTSIKEEKHTLSIHLFPNPNKGYFTLDVAAHKAFSRLHVYALNGSLVFTQALSTGPLHTIDTKLPAGMYLLELVGRESTAHSKLVIE